MTSLSYIFRTKSQTDLISLLGMYFFGDEIRFSALKLNYSNCGQMETLFIDFFYYLGVIYIM